MSIPLKEKLKTSLKLLYDHRILKALLSQYHSGYLVDEGWLSSFKGKSPVNRMNFPIPWLSYPCIDFIEERLNKSLSVFEFGCGNSTIYFASKTKKVVSVEHNLKWYKKIKAKIPDSVNLLYIEFHPNGEYAYSLQNLAEKYDIIIIDGMDRISIMKYAFEYLNSDGVMILDDSERQEYLEGIDVILENGFRRIDFWGVSAGVLFKKCTTIFYRSNNCLNI